MMDFYEVLDQVIDLLKQRGRVTYSALKRQFGIDDAFLKDLQDEILYAHPVIDDEDRGLVWTGDTAAIQGMTTSQSDQAAPQPTAQEEPPTQVASLPTEPHTPDAERRQLTILFTDLVDSTKLSGQLDAEEYREIVRAYQAACAEIIERYDCHLAQTLGDGLLVYSGYPVAHENDAERAVRVGLGILDAMKTLNERLEQEKGIRLGVRVGIHTGPVVVGAVGAGTRHEQLALGEVPNVAARIQGLAEPDTVVISAATYQLVEGYFDCEALGQHELRGVDESLSLHRVLGASGVQSRLDVASTRGLTPLVGRESEVTFLLERWSQVKDGQGQVMLLSGEAGIGKSRLVQALRDHISDEPHTRQECRCSPYHQNSAFFPLADLLQRKLGWQPDDTVDDKVHKLERVVAHTHLDVDTAVPLFTALLSLPLPNERYSPMQVSSQQQRQQTLEAFLRLVLLASEQHPVLLIVEDLHWIDPSTLEFLNLLIEQTPTTSIFVLLTCRPEFQPDWAHRSYLSEVSLHRLSPTQIEQIATQVAGGKTLPAEVVEQLVDRTDGVPLYIEEMTKAVLESGALKETDGQYKLTDSISSLSIPSTLQDSLMARLDRLATAKTVAQYASVIGRQFSYELLQAVSGLNEAMLQHELERLVDAELVYQRGVIPQATYMFKHALIQDTAYESLLRRTRQGYHRRSAEVLAEKFPETAENQPELLARHCTEAGLNEQAIDYWQLAGKRAIQRSAYEEAIAHLKQGLTVLKQLTETHEQYQSELDMQTLLGTALMAAKGQGAPEVGQVYARARVLCQHVGETPQLFSVLFGQWRFYFLQAEHYTARDVAVQCLNLARQLDAATLLLPAHFTLGASLLFLGDFVSAHAHLEQGRQLYDPQRYRSLAFDYGIDVELWCLSYTSWTLGLLGYVDQAVQRMHKALHLAQERGHPLSLAAVQVYVAFPYALRREGHTAQEGAETAMAFAREQEFPQWLTLGTIYHGAALVQQGHDEEGLAQLRQGLDAWQNLGAKLGVPWVLTLLADAHGKIGQVREGLNLLIEACAMAEKNGDYFWQAESHRVRGELQLQQAVADTSQAEVSFYQALNIARHQGAKTFELRAATSLATLWQSQDKRQEAYDLLAPVYGWFTEGFDTADLKDAKALLDELT